MLKKLYQKGFVLGIIFLFIGASFVTSIQGNSNKLNNVEEVIDTTSPPIPRWREGGTPYDSGQSLHPYKIQGSKLRDAPTSGLIKSPPEYEPSRGVIYCYKTGQWTAVVTDLVVSLTLEDRYDEIAYVVVSSTSQMNSAISQFTSGGANMSKVEFMIQPTNALWIRDYGPHFIWQNGSLGIVDSHYYPTRPLDNFIPTLLGDEEFIMPTYDMGLYYSGGNFLPGPNQTAFVSSLINLDNPSSQGFDAALIAELYQTYQGIDDLHIMPQLPFSVDGTGHIDMWMNIVDENTVIISEFIPGSDPTAITITNNAVPYMEALGFEVFRTPAWNVGSTHYTYTNTFRVNDRIFASTYGEGNPSYLDEDEIALSTYRKAAGPDVNIVPIDCYDIIPAAGAVHCIVMQVPGHTDSEPDVHVISPDGGELLVSGATETISWAATDTNNTVIPQIDLYYSDDDGETYNFIDTTTDTGFYDWTVPDVSTDQAKVKVVATSSDLDQGVGVSTEVFQIYPCLQTVYDFTIGAGIDKFGYGYRTSSWTIINGDRTPVTSKIDTLVTGAYTKISFSDATGGDSDSNRYISPYPTGSYESTHTYEFTIDEDPSEIDDIKILWEGYADYCTQIELYIWNYTEGQWGDEKGLSGQNRFMDNWAGNRDGYLEKHIRSNFNHYINPSGQMTLLLYAERNADRSFHDYIAITVSKIIAIQPDPNQSYVTLTGGIGMHPSLQSQYAEWYPFTVTVIDTGGQPMQGIPAENFTFTATLGTDTLSHCDLNSNMEWDPIDAQTDVNGEIQWRVRCTTSVTRDSPSDPTPNGGYINTTATVQSVALNDIDSLPVSSCDTDGDGWVSLSDFSRFAVDFGTNVQRSDYDFNGNVNLGDFSQFAVEFGGRQTC